MTPLSPTARKVCYGVIYSEAGINILNGALSLYSPVMAMGALTSRDQLPLFDGIAGEPVRWFAAVGVAFGGYLLLRVLSLRGKARLAALWPLLEALIVGDILYLSSLIPFTLAFASTGIVFPYALTFVMFIARAALLRWEAWGGDGSDLWCGGDEGAQGGDRGTPLVDAE